MPNSGAYLLSDVRAEKVEVICPICNRRGVLSVSGLMKTYGDIGMPDLLKKIAKAAGCPKALDPTDLEHCKAAFSPESVRTWTPQ